MSPRIGALSRGAARVMGSRFAKPVARVVLVALGLVLLAVIGRVSAAGAFGGAPRRVHPVRGSRRFAEPRSRGGTRHAEAAIIRRPRRPRRRRTARPPAPASCRARVRRRPTIRSYSTPPRRGSPASARHRTEARRRHSGAARAPRPLPRHRGPSQGQRHRPRDAQTPAPARPARPAPRPRRRRLRRHGDRGRSGGEGSRKPQAARRWDCRDRLSAASRPGGSLSPDRRSRSVMLGQAAR